MPVTIKPSPEQAGRISDTTYRSEDAFYKALVHAWEHDALGFEKIATSSRANLPILHSSLSHVGVTGRPIVPYRNGLVEGMIRAFQQDLHLTIRPDDVWLAILTQFSFFVNKNAESLRKHFVNHDGKVELVVGDLTTSFASLDVAEMAQRLALLMREKFVDAEICDWLLPVFTTTTDNDLTVSSMVMMATMKDYFTYVMCCGCGFPSITLLGEMSDWQMILDRLDRFKHYGDGAVEWSRLLYPVIKRFIATFLLPESEELKQFWMQAVHSIGRPGSGREFSPYSGWLTAFMSWDKDGERAISSLEVDSNGLPPLILDGVVYPFVAWRRDGIPSGVVEVPVTVKAFNLGVQIKTRIAAGSMGVTVDEGLHKDDSAVQPFSCWLMLEESREPL